MENEQTAGAHHVCSLLCVFDHQCDVRRQDNILPSICVTFGCCRMSVSIPQKGFKVAIVLLKKSNQNYNKLTDNKVSLIYLKKPQKPQVVCQPLLFFFRMRKGQIME